MRKFIYLLSIAAFIISCDKNNDEPAIVPKSIKEISLSMGAGYSNDIYYSLANGAAVSTPSRTEWDLGFYTDSRSSTIIINDGTIAGLYVWQGGDKTGWDNVDASGIDSQESLYNTYSDSTWQNGAFDKGALGHPDYGWGVYNSVTHDVDGDSIYIVLLKTDDPAINITKKLFIEKRQAADNTYHFKYANLDGSDEHSEVINMSDYSNKLMIHFSLTNNAIVDHEPAKTSWDLFFTQYNNDANQFYPTTGILVNEGVEVARVANVDTSYNEYPSQTYSKVISTIGASWKNYTGGQWVIDSTLVFFVKTPNGNYYKLVFTGNDGRSTGNLKFVQSTY